MQNINGLATSPVKKNLPIKLMTLVGMATPKYKKILYYNNVFGKKKTSN